MKHTQKGCCLIRKILLHKSVVVMAAPYSLFLFTFVFRNKNYFYSIIDFKTWPLIYVHGALLYSKKSLQTLLKEINYVCGHLLAVCFKSCISPFDVGQGLKTLQVVYYTSIWILQYGNQKVKKVLLTCKYILLTIYPVISCLSSFQILLQKVKTQHLHFRSHAEYFLWS